MNKIHFIKQSNIYFYIDTFEYLKYIFNNFILINSYKLPFKIKYPSILFYIFNHNKNNINNYSTSLNKLDKISNLSSIQLNINKSLNLNFKIPLILENNIYIFNSIKKIIIPKLYIYKGPFYIKFKNEFDIFLNLYNNKYELKLKKYKFNIFFILQYKSKYIFKINFLILIFLLFYNLNINYFYKYFNFKIIYYYIFYIVLNINKIYKNIHKNIFFILKMIKLFNYYFLKNYKYNKYKNIKLLYLFEYIFEKELYFKSFNNLKYSSIKYILIDILQIQIFKLINILKQLKSNIKIYYLKQNIILNEILNIHPFLQYLEEFNMYSKLLHINKVIKIQNKNFLKYYNLRHFTPLFFNKFCVLANIENKNIGLIKFLTLNSYIYNNKIYNYIYNYKFNLFFSNAYNTTGNIKYNFNTKKKIYYHLFNFNLTYLHSTTLNYNINFFNIVTNQIPFLNYIDSTRSLMAIKMLTQAVPYLYNSNILLNTTTEILIHKKNKSNKLYSISEGIVTYISNFKIIIKDILNRKVIYYLYKHIYNNQSQYFNFKPLVYTGERVFIGSILAENYTFLSNKLNISNNFIYLYAGYNNFEYEDAFILNKKILWKNIMFSIEFKIVELSFNNFNLVENYSFKIPKLSLKNIHNLKKGSYILNNNILIPKLKIINIKQNLNTNFNKFLINFIFGFNFQSIYDNSLYASLETEGRLISTEFFKLPTVLFINRIYILKLNNILKGDKISGKYANKGVIAYIEQPANLPYCLSTNIIPCLISGTIGITSRLNLGQLYELYFNNICHFYNISLGLNKYLKYNILYNYIVYKLSKLKDLQLNLHIYNTQKITMKDGISNKFISNYVIIGILSFIKLLHLTKKNYALRSVSTYNNIIQQPIKGKSYQGGQKFGEMEIWALYSYNSIFNLYTLLNAHSDNINERNFLNIKNFKLFKSSFSEIFKIISSELKGLAINIDLNYYIYLKSKYKHNINKFNYIF